MAQQSARFSRTPKNNGRDALIQNLWCWGTTEKLGKPSGLKDTDEADWVPDKGCAWNQVNQKTWIASLYVQHAECQDLEYLEE